MDPGLRYLIASNIVRERTREVEIQARLRSKAGPDAREGRGWFRQRWPERLVGPTRGQLMNRGTGLRGA